MGNVIKPNAIEYPVMCFGDDLAEVLLNEEELTICGRSDLGKKGWFDGLQLVDSAGRRYRVVKAKKLHAIGPFWGFRLFLSQRIKVDLGLELIDDPTPLEAVKQLLWRASAEWRGWESAGVDDELRDAAKRASTVADLIRIMCDAQRRSFGPNAGTRGRTTTQS